MQKNDVRGKDGRDETKQGSYATRAKEGVNIYIVRQKRARICSCLYYLDSLSVTGPAIYVQEKVEQRQS